jgi:hypothetical protein
MKSTGLTFKLKVVKTSPLVKLKIMRNSSIKSDKYWLNNAKVLSYSAS